MQDGQTFSFCRARFLKKTERKQKENYVANIIAKGGFIRKRKLSLFAEIRLKEGLCMNRIEDSKRKLKKMKVDYKKVTNKVIVGINNLRELNPTIILSAEQTIDFWHIVKTKSEYVGIFVFPMPETQKLDWNSILDELNSKEYTRIIHISVNTLGNTNTLRPNTNGKTKFIVLNNDIEIENFSVESYL